MKKDPKYVRLTSRQFYALTIAWIAPTLVITVILPTVTAVLLLIVTYSLVVYLITQENHE